MGDDQLVQLYEDTKGGGRCRGCDARIDWYETVAGRRMPMNAGAVPRKSASEPSTNRVIVFMAASDSHWASCPEQKHFKRWQR